MAEFVLLTTLEGRDLCLARALIGTVRPFQLGDPQGLGCALELLNGQALGCRSRFEDVTGALAAADARVSQPPAAPPALVASGAPVNFYARVAARHDEPRRFLPSADTLGEPNNPPAYEPEQGR